jgi:hypothetical protein
MNLFKIGVGLGLIAIVSMASSISGLNIVIAQENPDPLAVMNGYCKMLDATKIVDDKVYERIAKKYHPEGQPHEIDPVEASYANGLLNVTEYQAFKNQNITTCSDVQIIDNFKHVNENYSPDDPNNPENIIIQYCVQHADRVALGENVIQDLVTAGLVPDAYSTKTCREVQEQNQWDKAVQEYNENNDAP